MDVKCGDKNKSDNVRNEHVIKKGKMTTLY